MRLLITSAVIPLAKVCFRNEEQENELLPVLKQMHEDKSWRVRQAYTKEIVEILKVKRHFGSTKNHVFIKWSVLKTITENNA